MIRCPRCGAQAAWGASQCPQCFAPFVAPPTAQPTTPQQFHAPNVLPGFNPGLHQAANRSGKRATAIAFGLFVLALLGFFAMRRNASVASVQTHESVATNTQSPTAPDQSGSMFKISPQTAKRPSVSISNNTLGTLRFTLRNDQGGETSQLIAPESTLDLEVDAGHYLARVEMPDDIHTLPTEGSADVENFHHYQASFFVAPNDGQPNTFHIGD